MSKSVGKHSPETIREFWRLHWEGYTYKAISKKIKVSVWVLHDWRRCKTHYMLNNRLREQYGFDYKGNAA